MAPTLLATLRSASSLPIISQPAIHTIPQQQQDEARALRLGVPHRPWSQWFKPLNYEFAHACSSPHAAGALESQDEPPLTLPQPFIEMQATLRLEEKASAPGLGVKPESTHLDISQRPTQRNYYDDWDFFLDEVKPHPLTEWRYCLSWLCRGTKDESTTASCLARSEATLDGSGEDGAAAASCSGSLGEGDDALDDSLLLLLELARSAAAASR